jgi:ketosteroid isomerase-like protein
MMSKAEETRETVLSYFNAWTTKRPDEASAFLADDLVFWGPTASYTSAQQFRPALVAFCRHDQACAIDQTPGRGRLGGDVS